MTRYTPTPGSTIQTRHQQWVQACRTLTNATQTLRATLHTATVRANAYHHVIDERGDGNPHIRELALGGLPAAIATYRRAHENAEITLSYHRADQCCCQPGATPHHATIPYARPHVTAGQR
jgi:hypothetical protein